MRQMAFDDGVFLILTKVQAMKDNSKLIEYDKNASLICFPFQRRVMPQLLQICKPLFEKLNMRFFSHIRNFRNGSFTSLMTDVDVTEFYINQYKINFSSGKGFSLPAGYYVAEHIANKSSAEGRSAICQQFNLANFFYIVESRAEYDDMFAFATAPDNTTIINSYLNEIAIFNHFLLYYKDQAKYLLQQADRIIYSADYFFEESSLVNRNNYSDEICKEMPLKKIPVHGNLGEVIISRRELECWKYIIQNYSFKEIGRLLGLSNRTVETYVNNLKSKLGCDTARSLVQLAKTLNL